MLGVKGPRENVQGADCPQTQECCQDFAARGREQGEQTHVSGCGPSSRSTRPPPGRLGGGRLGQGKGRSGPDPLLCPRGVHGSTFCSHCPQEGLGAGGPRAGAR